MNIYVGNVAAGVSEEQLRSLFGQHGTVKKVSIIKDKFTGEHRGFAFVEMSTMDEGNQAINALNGAEVGGQRLRINEARPREDRPRRPYNGGGSNGGGYQGGGYNRNNRY